jgi:hypothetical protein
VQGYVYAAYLARAHLAHEAGDEDAVQTWARRASDLKEAFNERFWLEDRGWVAVGLDRDKRPIDALASNMGHCLWTGILDEDKAARVADHLVSPEMFTGWGVRTLASSMGAYNPMSYHNGSVWPHENALIVGGLIRYGFVEHGQRIAEGILDAAAAFEGRLPELFCGFDRSEFRSPLPYPAGLGVGGAHPARARAHARGPLHVPPPAVVRALVARALRGLERREHRAGRGTADDRGRRRARGAERRPRGRPSDPRAASAAHRDGSRGRRPGVRRGHFDLTAAWGGAPWAP